MLLPLAIVIALFFVSQGVIQNLRGYVDVTTLEGLAQRIPMGPNASQEAIKVLGINGGGFFNANSAHPLSNPSPLTNLVQMLAIFSIPAGLTYTFGLMVGDRRQGWAIFAAMSVLFLAGVLITYWAESAGNPVVNALGPGNLANMEGKETRFGITGSTLFAVVTTAASCGAVNSFLDSFTPIGGLVPMVNIQLGEVIFGGVGSGLAVMLIFAIIALFVGGLMVGRTPEYLGKKLQAREIKFAMLVVLVPSLSILSLTALASVAGDCGTKTILNPGPHGLSEMLYAYTSGTGNNGSAFGGIGVNTIFYNLTIGVAMLVGRFFVIAEDLGATVVHLTGKDVAAALAAYARAEHATQLIVGHSQRSRWEALVKGSVVDRVLRLLPSVDLHIIAERERATGAR